ncbi:SKIP/SNW domain containing protein [Gracilaria domingensis]|nr:SKIP/SNW domain containing protein [Gracilaria domingensis]
MSLLKLLPPPSDGNVPAPRDRPPARALAVRPAQPSAHAGVSRVLSLPVRNDGPDYAAIVRQGENASRVVHTSYDALVEKPRDEVLQPMPSTHQIEQTARRTRAAIEQVLSGKLAATSGSHAQEKPSFVRYTPANTNTTAATGSRQRIIRMVEAPSDPMEPPKFSHRKAPVNPPSPPVPVMHSPDRKPTKAEAAEWKIPPVVSNWKNNRGYTIALDKRLAADGRAHVDHSINDRFADMAEALYNAERVAREQVERRARLQRQVSAKAKEAKERELRELAEKARRERKGYLGLSERTDIPSSAAPSEVRGFGEYSAVGSAVPVEDEAPPLLSSSEAPETTKRRRRTRFGDRGEGGEGVDDDMRRRDEVRTQRRIQRERELRGREENNLDMDRPTLKRSKLTRDQDRDIAERVALGQSATGKPSGEVMYDQRLFNQEAGGSRRGGISIVGGYGADDAYNIYDKPLFVGSNSAAKFQYQTSLANDVDERERRFRADRGFGGGNDKEEAPAADGPRNKPVEFERDVPSKRGAGDDPYGMDKFFEEARSRGK